MESDPWCPAFPEIHILVFFSTISPQCRHQRAFIGILYLVWVRVIGFIGLDYRVRVSSIHCEKHNNVRHVFLVYLGSWYLELTALRRVVLRESETSARLKNNTPDKKEKGPPHTQLAKKL